MHSDHVSFLLLSSLTARNDSQSHSQWSCLGRVRQNNCSRRKPLFPSGLDQDSRIHSVLYAVRLSFSPYVSNIDELDPCQYDMPLERVSM